MVPDGVAPKTVVALWRIFTVWELVSWPAPFDAIKVTVFAPPVAY